MKKRTMFKSKKKLSGVRCEYRKWNVWDVGDILIGKYVGSKTDNYDKPNWLIEVLEAQFVKKKKLAAKLEGKTIGLNSCGKVDAAMKKATEGDTIQFTFNGTGVIEGGKFDGKEAYDVDVEVGDMDDGSEPEEEEETDENEESEESEEEEEDDDDDSGADDL